MVSDAAKRYLEKAKGLPFFYVVGNEEYARVLSELQQAGVLVDHMSTFCPHQDKMPDLDAMVDHFRMADIDYARNKHVLVGLGEYLLLRGSDFAKKELKKLSTSTLGNARVILLLRGVASYVRQMIDEDPRLSAQERVAFAESEESEFSITCVKKNLAKTNLNGMKELLRAFEDGETQKTVCTTLEFPLAMMKVSQITTSFDMIRRRLPATISFDEEMGAEDQWDALRKELEENGNSLDAVFERHGVSEDPESEVYQKITAIRFKAWLYFIYLKAHSEDLKNKYLQYVLKATNKAEDLKDNILLEIIHIPRTNRFFKAYYESRKKLIRDFNDAEFALFVQKNKIDAKEAIYRYTDTTFTEREEIIKWVAKNGMVKELDDIYPALDVYLKDYKFKCGAMSEMLTDYFNEYRIQKVVNKFSFREEFLERVEKNAESPMYLKLDHRDSALLQIPDKANACLCWVDALGVEYLAYITERARQRGLSIQVKIARSDLPTITSINRKFYDDWSGKIKYKVSDLDEIKHKGQNGYDYQKTKAPIHLARELEIIDRIVDEAYVKLAQQACSFFIIASDHGASRLAVIKEQEEKYETDTKGEHSGRCCKEFDGAILDHALHENGYIVLTDYGRFKGSHAANVEVHGGGSLEEVIVPVITLRLKKYSETEVKLLNKDKIYADRHTGTEIQLYISRVENSEKVSVSIDGKFYLAKCEDESHYTVRLSDAKRASKKVLTASVYDGDNTIGEINFEIKSKVAKMNDDFDLI